jgi:hypothetical protein
MKLALRGSDVREQGWNGARNLAVLDAVVEASIKTNSKS